MSVADSTYNLDEALHDRFGLERFRPGQREAIVEVLAGRDVLCVMPTGGGKSLCYQLSAVLLPGVTLVVSPLIALMKDQVDALTVRGIRATLINSTLDANEQAARIAEVEMGRYDLVYVAPERFRSGRFVEMMNRVKPALLAVDEAHCISEWGHDFRPDYARLGLARKALGMPPCIALTATATDQVRRDIADQLDLRDPAQFVTGFDRPNLSYRVIEARKDVEKLTALAQALERNPGAAVVYASSRKKVEEVGNFLGRELRREAVIYHAGLERDARTEAQERFMSGRADVVVATNAFGMGVDKSNIRAVVHFNMPGTVEAYYQEAGRAGRDGLPAECVLIHAPGDRYLQEMFIENEYPPPDAVYRVYDYLRGIEADPIELTQSEIKEAVPLDLNETAVGTALRILESAGALERFSPRENQAIIRIQSVPEEGRLADRVSSSAHVQKIVMTALEGLVNRRIGEPVYFHPDDFATSLGLDRSALTRALKNLCAELPIDYIPPFRGHAIRVLNRSRKARDLKIDFSTLQKRKNQEYDKLERMIKYAEARACRRAYILQYFGDPEVSRCGRCDNCGVSPTDHPSQTASVDTPAGREVLQKVLSGVARSKGKFGKTAVAKMLVGSSSEQIERSGLMKLSTFGILAGSGFTQKEVVEILDALLAGGLVEAEDVDRFRPVVKLSEAGWTWIKSTTPPSVELALTPYLAEKVRSGGLERLTPAAKPPEPPPQTTADFDADADASGWEPPSAANGDPLYETLKALRLQWAKAANVRAFQVFSNRVLEELVRLRPTTPRDLAAIKGIGPSTLERYGSGLLDAIRGGGPGSPRGASPSPSPRPSGPEPEFAEPPPLPRPPQSASSSSATAYVPTEELTWKLLDRGFSVEEAAAIRGLESSAILRHASWMLKKGKPVPVASFLDPERAALWDAWLARSGEVAPESDPLAASLWALFVQCRRLGGE